MKCDGCGQRFRKPLPAHGPCPVGEKIPIPPAKKDMSKEIQDKLKKLTRGA